MQLRVRVKPGTSRTNKLPFEVGGSYPDPAGPLLVVRVTERAVEGKATQAVCRAVAEAFGVRPRQVSLINGATSRVKTLEVAGDVDVLTARLAQLLESAAA